MTDATATTHPTLTSPPTAAASGMDLLPPMRSILCTLASLGHHDVLTRLLVAADFSEDLSSGPPLTLFAPTDAAFAAIDETAAAWLAAERTEELCDLLEHHLVRGTVDLSQALSDGALGSVYGAAIPVDQDARGIRVGGARLEGAPVPCANGLLVPIDRVLTVPPPNAGSAAPHPGPAERAPDPLRTLAAAALGALVERGRTMEPTTLAPRSNPRSTGHREEARAALLRLAPTLIRPVEDVARGAAALLGLRSS